MVDHSEKWNYSESFLWGNKYPQCNGLIQSPIDINKPFSCIKCF